MTTRVNVGLLVLALCVALMGCSRVDKSARKAASDPVPPELREEATPDSEQSGSAPPQNSPAAALSQKLREVHEAADSARSREQKLAAARNLLSLYESISSEGSPHLISVQQDLLARAAHFQLESSPARAKELVERGLLLSSTPSILRANLFLALADAEEALGNQERAKKALMEALAINENLFESEMETP